MLPPGRFQMFRSSSAFSAPLAHQRHGRLGGKQFLRQFVRALEGQAVDGPENFLLAARAVQKQQPAPGGVHARRGGFLPKDVAGLELLARPWQIRRGSCLFPPARAPL